ncbi:MAG: hypothetical protein IH598_13030 [Bacteroidales bacterium]|nr:hypothetical protein [Bacteroidales bacterium]
MTQGTLRAITGWTIVIVTLFSAFLIYFFEGFNLLFLILLLFEMILVVRYRRIFSLGMIRTSQVLIGLLFLFSGFVKAVDPLGTAYQIEDYLDVYRINYGFGLSIFLSFTLNATELLLGGLMLLNIKHKITPWLVAFMMGVFTLTTLYDAIYNPVPDCGCFGDAVIMTNWQTFYKNLAINVFVLIVLLGRFKVFSVFRSATEWRLAATLAILFTGFQYMNYINLPMLDFRPYKIGNRLTPENPQPVKNYLTYRNKITGETKEYLSPDYPFDDPEWLENWEFVSQRIDDPNKVNGMNLSVIDFYGEDLTKYIMQNPDYHFIAVAWNLDKSDKDAFQLINQLYLSAEQKGIQFIVLTATLEEQIQEFIVSQALSPDMQFHYSDDIELKTMIRANPGLFLIHDGVIVKKWHHNDLPEWGVLEQEYFAER